MEPQALLFILSDEAPRNKHNFSKQENSYENHAFDLRRRRRRSQDPCAVAALRAWKDADGAAGLLYGRAVCGRRAKARDRYAGHGLRRARVCAQAQPYDLRRGLRDRPLPRRAREYDGRNPAPQDPGPDGNDCSQRLQAGLSRKAAAPSDLRHDQYRCAAPVRLSHRCVRRRGADAHFARLRSADHVLHLQRCGFHAGRAGHEPGGIPAERGPDAGAGQRCVRHSGAAFAGQGYRNAHPCVFHRTEELPVHPARDRGRRGGARKARSAGCRVMCAWHLRLCRMGLRHRQLLQRHRCQYAVLAF